MVCLGMPRFGAVRFGLSGRTPNLFGVRCGSGPVQGNFAVWTWTAPEPEITVRKFRLSEVFRCSECNQSGKD